MAIDFTAHAGALARARDALLSAGGPARLSCPRGHRAHARARRPRGHPDDGDLTAPGAFGNLPCGEGFIAPLGGEGTIVASSLAPLGLGEEPALLTVERGRLVAARSAARAGLPAAAAGPRRARHEPRGARRRHERTRAADRATSSRTRRSSAPPHVAFGASAGIGGNVSVPIHLDVVVLDASLEVDGRPDPRSRPLRAHVGRIGGSSRRRGPWRCTSRSQPARRCRRAGQDDHPAAARLLGAEYRCWDDPEVEWERYDRVVIRSTWDYTWRSARVRRVGASASARAPAATQPELVAFNVDKRYLRGARRPAACRRATWRLADRCRRSRGRWS